MKSLITQVSRRYCIRKFPVREGEAVHRDRTRKRGNQGFLDKTKSLLTIGTLKWVVFASCGVTFAKLK